MRQRFSTSWIALTLTLWLGVGSVLAHITPPVVLLSEQDAVRARSGSSGAGRLKMSCTASTLAGMRLGSSWLR